jgi:hypothetical protein|nr:MAG TPA: protein of unknown function (DUF5320) [Caudoviricetes sp.]
MTNEELEQEVKRLEEQIKDLKATLEEKVEKKPYEVEVPEDVGDNYFIGEYGNIYSLEGCNMNLARIQYRLGLAFKTEEEAEQHLKESILLFKLRKWAEEHNGGWTPNWDDFEEKQYHVVYDYEDKQFYVRYEHYSETFTKLPYLKSYNLAEQFIEEFGDEIKEVLC